MAAMRNISLSVLFWVALCFQISKELELDSTSSTCPIERKVNNRPIIGILAFVSEPLRLTSYGKTHIPASYVKYLESSGARVVPIMLNKPISYYQKMTQNLNGIFLPGSVAITDQIKDDIKENEAMQGLDFIRAATLLFNFTLQENMKGNYLPMWGTCLGFQALAILSAQHPDSMQLREQCNANNLMAPIEFTEDAYDSRLFSNAPQSVINTLRNQNVTAHYHNFCQTEETMEKFGITKFWRILSTNRDIDGIKFVSTIESIEYPFYGTVYHTEKSPFDWDEEDKTPHDMDAIQASQYFGNFFVNEARKNYNKFESKEEEKAALIYNYPVTYTDTFYEQTYFFD